VSHVIIAVTTGNLTEECMRNVCIICLKDQVKCISTYSDPFLLIISF